MNAAKTTDGSSHKLVNNTGCDIRMFMNELLAAVDSGVLPVEFEDLFSLTILRAYNADGSDRGVLDAA